MWGHTDGEQGPTPTETQAFRRRHGYPYEQNNHHEASRCTDGRMDVHAHRYTYPDTSSRQKQHTGSRFL